MKLTKEQLNEFYELSEKLMEFVANNAHPHTTIVVTSTSAHLYEQLHGVNTTKFIKG